MHIYDLLYCIRYTGMGTLWAVYYSHTIYGIYKYCILSTFWTHLEPLKLVVSVLPWTAISPNIGMILKIMPPTHLTWQIFYSPERS